jgi:hypothetical protein
MQETELADLDRLELHLPLCGTSREWIRSLEVRRCVEMRKDFRRKRVKLYCKTWVPMVASCWTSHLVSIVHSTLLTAVAPSCLPPTGSVRPFTHRSAKARNDTWSRYYQLHLTVEAQSSLVPCQISYKRSKQGLYSNLSPCHISAHTYSTAPVVLKM